MATIDMNLEGVCPELGRPLPPGDYRCRVADSLLVRSKSGRPLLKFIHEVVDGPEAGKRLVDAMLLDHEAGLVRLKTLAWRLGHPDPNFLHDSEELHGLGFVAKVALDEEQSGQAGPRNRVTAYRALSGTGKRAPGMAERSGQAVAAGRALAETDGSDPGVANGHAALAGAGGLPPGGADGPDRAEAAGRAPGWSAARPAGAAFGVRIDLAGALAGKRRISVNE